MKRLPFLLLIHLLGASLAPAGAATSVPADKPPAGVKRGMAEVNGTRLYYEIAGKGEPVVLLEGGQLDRRMWDDQFAAFSREFHVVRFDVRGFGDSAPRRGKYQSHEDLSALLDALEIPQAHLVGLSLGGRIAIDLALTHPGQVRSLVLAGPGLSGFPWSQERPSWAERLQRAVAAGDARAAALAWLDSDYMKPAAVSPKIGGRVKELALANADTWIQPDEEEELKPPAFDRLAEIHAPALVLVGSLGIPDIQRIVDQLARNVPGARKVALEGAGHMLNLEAPARFNTLVLDFLRQQSKTLTPASPAP